MKLRIDELVLVCKRDTEHIVLNRVNYFYGRMGAGKSTIARLVDFCLGGELEMTPALQNEFVSASITLTIGSASATFSRHRGAAQIEASWTGIEGPFRLMVPVRQAGGELLADTGVEVISDLVMYLAGVPRPKVRKSKVRDDSAMVRLSLRDLFWYCYLDQATIDSTFYYLEKGADHFRQLKSRDVIRYVLGYNQERVTEIELELEQTREQKMRAEEGARALARALNATGFEGPEDLAQRKTLLETRRFELRGRIEATRTAQAAEHDSSSEELRERGRRLAAEIDARDDAIRAIDRVVDNDRRHRNELITLSMRSCRAADARAVLSQVEFVACPRCTQQLPERPAEHCTLCGQHECDPAAETTEVLGVDVAARIAELDDLIKRHGRQRGLLQRERSQLQDDKVRLDRDLNEASRRYDSAYLTSMLHVERELAATEQQLVELGRAMQLNEQCEVMRTEAKAADVTIAKLRSDLAEARASAERDTANIRRLEQLFLDCLLRARLPGFSASDAVTIAAPNFFPEVTAPGADSTVVTSFSHLGSGGKKTLFKCCFAVALHRLAVEIAAPLPPLLMIDTAMKNISERENRDQFAGFYSMLYDLAVTELQDTQFVVIDKEFFPPPPGLGSEMVSRAMTPDDPMAPPLIRSYRGH